MVWKIFAPRFMYEGISSYFAFGAILLAFLLILRINVSFDRLIQKIAIPEVITKNPFKAFEKKLRENIQNLENNREHCD